MVVHIAPIGRDTKHVEEWLREITPVTNVYLIHSKKKDEIDDYSKNWPSGNVEIGEDFFSVTQVNGAILCYFLGNSVERARNCFISAWKILRQEVIGFEAVEPRIWKT